MSKGHKPKTLPRKVDFTDGDGRDVQLARLLSLGLTHKTCAKAVGYTPSQASYRAAAAKIKTSEYRNGTGIVGKLVLVRKAPLSDTEVKTLVRQHLDKQGLTTAKNGRKKGR